MKTSIQELIEQFNEEIARAEQRGDFEIKRILQVALSLANMKLNREKEVMNETWDSATDCLEEFETFDDYYNETFNTKEK